jgi:hypothetical protein
MVHVSVPIQRWCHTCVCSNTISSRLYTSLGLSVCFLAGWGWYAARCAVPRGCLVRLDDDLMNAPPPGAWAVVCGSHLSHCVSTYHLSVILA